MKIYILIVSLVVGLLMMWTYERNETYRSEVALLEDCLAKSPNKGRVMVNLAFAYKKIGKHEEGIAVLTRAFDIDPELIPFLKASIYAGKEGGKLIVEKDVWNKDPRRRQERQPNMNPIIERIK